MSEPVVNRDEQMVEKLKERIAELAAQLKDALISNKSLHEQRNKAWERIAELEAENERLGNQVDAFGERIAQLEYENNLLKEETEHFDLQIENEGLKQRIAELEAECEQIRKVRDEWCAAFTKARDRLAEMEDFVRQVALSPYWTPAANELLKKGKK